jgi:DNA-binding HxlR family transcriptional regulator
MEDGTSTTLGHIQGTDEDWWEWARRSGACEARRTLDLIGDKWSVLVIALLGGRRRRFSELKREIDGISQRMLTLTLRQLERDGLVERTVFAVVPPRVDYELTQLGETLLATVQSLIDWAIGHHAEIAQARDRYDAQALDAAEQAERDTPRRSSEGSPQR